MRETLARKSNVPDKANCCDDPLFIVKDMYQNFVFDFAVRIIRRVEFTSKIVIPDDSVDEALPWEKLTLSHLSAAVCCSSVPPLSPLEGNEVIRAALRVEFPKGPKPEVMDFAVPLFDFAPPEYSHFPRSKMSESN